MEKELKELTIKELYSLYEYYSIRKNKLSKKELQYLKEIEKEISKRNK